MKTYKVNHWLYGGLLLGAVGVTLSSLLIPTCSPWFTIVTGWGCGGFASVVVAWLIDVFNCKSNNRKAERLQNAAFAELISSFETGIQPFIFKIESIDKSYKKQSMTWSDWLDVAYNLSSSGAGGEKDWFVRIYMVFERDIADKIKVLNFQRTQLLQDGIISEKDGQAIPQLASWCSVVESEYSFINDHSAFFSKIPFEIKILKSYIDGAIAIKQINVLKIASIIKE